MKTSYNIGDILTTKKNNLHCYFYVYDITIKFTPKVAPLITDSKGEQYLSKYVKTLHWSRKNNAWQVHGLPLSKVEDKIANELKLKIDIKTLPYNNFQINE